MYTKSVFIPAGRRLGIPTTLFLLAVSMQAAEIVVTVTGTLSGGADGAGIFNAGKSLDGLPFELVFRFDDSKGMALVPNQSCPTSGSGITAIQGSSPGTAVLTVNGVSHEFGKTRGAKSMAYRSIASWCSESGLRFEVDEGSMGYFNTVVNVIAEPQEGTRSLTQETSWRAPLSTTAIKEWSNRSGFGIVRNMMHQSGAQFKVKSITVEKEK
jgi:hypothetical protein